MKNQSLSFIPALPGGPEKRSFFHKNPRFSPLLEMGPVSLFSFCITGSFFSGHTCFSWPDVSSRERRAGQGSRAGKRGAGRLQGERPSAAGQWVKGILRKEKGASANCPSFLLHFCPLKGRQSASIIPPMKGGAPKAVPSIKISFPAGLVSGCLTTGQRQTGPCPGRRREAKC